MNEEILENGAETLGEITEENTAEAAAEETAEIPDYALNYTGEEVDAAIGKAHRMIAGRVKLTAQFGAAKGLYQASAAHDLSAYVVPVCVAAADGGSAEEPINMTVSKTGVNFIVKTSDQTARTRYVHYIIMEGGQ